jgi:hypothetical protein
MWFDNESAPQTKTTRDKGRGRIETREYSLETDINWLFEKPAALANAVGSRLAFFLFLLPQEQLQLVFVPVDLLLRLRDSFRCGLCHLSFPLS